MNDIMDFAIQSARRQAKICRLRKIDNDAKSRSGVVRDAKHPKNKEGNHRRFKYAPEAWAIVKRQPADADLVFPYNPRSVGAAFTRACQNELKRYTNLRPENVRDIVLVPPKSSSARHQARSPSFGPSIAGPSIAPPSRAVGLLARPGRQRLLAMATSGRRA